MNIISTQFFDKFKSRFRAHKNSGCYLNSPPLFLLFNIDIEIDIKMKDYLQFYNIYFKLVMRAHRGKQLDWSKPFKLVDSKTVFEDLDNDNNELVINITAKVQATPPPIAKKEEIIVPKIQTVKRITEPKKFARVDPNYIRLSPQLNLPKLQSYELNEVDHVFLQGHSNKFKFNGKVVLTPQFLSRAFIELEKKAGKDPNPPRQKTIMTNFIEREHKELTTMSNYDNFTEVFYNYWKNRREQLKFPMLRELWRPNPQQYSHLLAFKARDKQKRNLRRNNRLAQDEIAQQMEEEFLLATKIAQRIKLREDLKMKQINLMLTNFHNDCKQYFGMPTFFNQFDSQSRVKDKQKLKKFQADIQNVKKLQIEEQKEEPENFISATFDQKQSIAQFLSTVVSTADSFGLSFDRLFNDRVAIPPPKPISLPPQQVQVKDQKHDFMSLSLYRYNDTIYRTFSGTDDELQIGYIKKPKDIFQLRARQLKSYYYGSDDQGDTKDLRKNITAGFKKFLAPK